MTMIKIYKIGESEQFERERTRQNLNYSRKVIENIRTETCYYVEISENAKFDGSSCKKKLLKLLGDQWVAEGGLTEETQLHSVGSDSIIVEIGPRLSYSTPWSTNCGSICKSAGIDNVSRIEKSARYLLTFSSDISYSQREEAIQSLYDPMTQEVYDVPLKNFTVPRDPDQWHRVDILEEGRSALEKINSLMGLAFDEWDLDYYTHLFKEKIRRNPTTVELFDLAQSNSEHSRHWFFKGKYKVDGKELSQSLLDMVINTNNESTTNNNNVIKFTDNSSGIKGWKIPLVIMEDPKAASQLMVVDKLRHIIFTAETHNFPTGVCPFSGATTGTGGRIRDVQAAGRGGHVIAGTAGYCFGNLLLNDYRLDWEDITSSYPSNFASPLEIVIEASNGASDYGNKFGEPVICGFSRSFGLIVGNDKKQERREWIKPIMFSGGIGTLDGDMVNKEDPRKDQLVVKIGGPVYRIGVGGGAASSVQVQGDNAATRDLGAVQRGDAEMEQKLNRVIRGCLEMKENPILAIHDQGAGGNANVLKELMEGSGGVVYTKAFNIGDETLSTLEIWGAEYQESNAILMNPSCFDNLSLLAKRERCPIDKVGVITDDRKVRVYETEFQNPVPDLKENESLPVNLELDWVLGKMPKKVFEWTKKRVLPSVLTIPSYVSPMETVNRILRLPSVASKRFLTNKVDRSVTGLVAQQQCVGPLQTPLADVAVVALSYFAKEGAATSIGEQPIKLLVDPSAGARMTVLESLSNLASCLISDLKDVKCSGNWMWPAKLPGEGYALYEACESMCNIMKQLGVAVDGGKDSLSMAARVPEDNNPSKPNVVKAPGSLVVSSYAPCPDVSKVVTPDLKSPGRGTKGALVLMKPSFDQFRCGGSALAQVYRQIGSHCPDVNENETKKFVAAFNCIQALIEDGLLLSLHDISDGGIATCLIEMAIAGWGGLKVTLPKPSDGNIEEKIPVILAELFNEEIGWVLEISEHDLVRVMDIVSKFDIEDITMQIGTTGSAGPDSLIEFTRNQLPILSMTVCEAAMMWEETSYQLERHQMNKDLADQEFTTIRDRKHVDYVINFQWKDFKAPSPNCQAPNLPRIAVIREEGSNGDREMSAAFIQAGFIVHDITMSDFSNVHVNLDQFRGISFPGGFSYADVLGSGVGWAASITERERIKNALDNWHSKDTTFSLGVCNGCQLMALLGWIGDGDSRDDTPHVRLKPNDSGRYESRWSRVKIYKSKSVLLKEMEGSVLGVWVAHGEGKFTYWSKRIKEKIAEGNCIAMQYVQDDGTPTENYPFNPNGSEDGVAGLVSSCGRHLALMPHPERSTLSWQLPYSGPLKPASSQAAPWSKLFQNAFDWCIAN